MNHVESELVRIGLQAATIFGNISLFFETVPRVFSIAARTEALVCSLSKEGEQEDVSLRGLSCANAEMCKKQWSALSNKRKRDVT